MRRNIILPLIAILAVIAIGVGIGTDFFRSTRDGLPLDKKGLVKVVLATDWKAEAEHGGFYEAKAEGLYAKAGLDVQIMMGGPSVNVPQLLAANAIDFGIASNQFIAMNAAQHGVPATAVMASFQKDPQVLITHQRDDINSIADMAGKPIMISDATVGSFWLWLKAKYGFTDDQIRKYTFNLAPFLSDPKAIQQGYVTSEPYQIEKATGKKPKVFLLADYGYPGYGSIVMARNDLIDSHPELVRAFVQATIQGWQDYLEGNPAPANKLIKKDNPEMSDDVLAQAIAKMKQYNIVIPDKLGDAGIGQMSNERWQQFYQLMNDYGLLSPDFDYTTAYTLEFLPDVPSN
jgi:NitT/TauT family transport system substrate-binding protein